MGGFCSVVEGGNLSADEFKEPFPRHLANLERIIVFVIRGRARAVAAGLSLFEAPDPHGIGQTWGNHQFCVFVSKSQAEGEEDECCGLPRGDFPRTSSSDETLRQ
jgi:hypothetical protein